MALLPDWIAPATLRWRSAMLVAGILFIVCRGAAVVGGAQAPAGAEANQLHAAIVNGDLESLRYWLDVRQADASRANASEPDVTPLERCLALAAEVLDAPSAGAPVSREKAHAVSLRVLQDMVTLLHAHGASITDADRQRYKGAVLRWYDDAVSPAAAAPAKGTANPPAPSAPPSDGPRFLAKVLITTDTRASCNGKGHPVYLVNETQLSVTATVTSSEAGTPTTPPGVKSDQYTVDPGTSWRLGCDITSDGRPVRYELTRWR